MTDYVLVFITTASEKEGEKIASALVKERLAACVSMVGGVRSTFRWKGQISTAGGSPYSEDQRQAL